MNIKKIIQEEVDDLSWMDSVEDTVTWEQLRFGDKVELVYTDKSDDFWDGTRGTVVRKDSDSISINVVTKDGDTTLIMFDESFDVGPNRRYKFKVLNNMNESDDFDWIRDIVPLAPLTYKSVNNMGLEFDPPITDRDYYDMVVTSLRDAKVRVRVNMPMIDLEDGVLGLFIDEGRALWTGNIGEEPYQEHIDDFAGRHVTVIDGRSLFPR